MFNKRRRTNRRGPPANQIYVPHDQRKLTQDPIPIMTEKQAQYYFQQLYDMGYIPQPVIQPQQVIQVKMVQDSQYVTFKVNEQTKTIGTSNIDANNCDPYDIYGNLLDKTKYDLINILNQNGYKLVPIICSDNISMYNTTTGSRNLSYTLLNGTTSSTAVPGQTYFKIYDHFPYFSKAFPGMEENKCIFYAYSDIDTLSVPIAIYGNSASFALACKYLTCLIYPT